MVAPRVQKNQGAQVIRGLEFRGVDGEGFIESRVQRGLVGSQVEVLRLGGGLGGLARI